MARTTFVTAVSVLVLFSNTANAQSSPVTIQNPGFGFSYIGCYNEVTNPRALPDAELLSSQQAMTVETCAQFCQSYTFMGVEYGSECYCGKTVSNMSSEVSTESGLSCSDPQYACAGNQNEQCGGDSAFDFYAKAGATSTAVAPSSTGFEYVMDSSIVYSVAGPSGNYEYIGCWVDPGVTTRALNGASTAYGARDVEECSSHCDGYTYFGLEDGGECYCGNSIDNGAGLAACQSECYQCCADNVSERCGGYYRLGMYELNGPNFTAPSQTAACTYNGPATAIVMGSTSYMYYGPITTGSTQSDVVTVDGNGQTTSYTSTEFYCEGGCNTNQHTPGGSITVMEGNVTASGITLTCGDPDYACTGDDTEQCGGFATIDIWHCPQNDPRSSVSLTMTPTSVSAGSTTTIDISISTPPIDTSNSMGSSTAFGSTSTPLGSFSAGGEPRNGTIALGGSMSTQYGSLSTCGIKTAVVPVTYY